MPWQGAWALQAEAGSYPWQPCELKPPLLATTNWHRHTKTRSVEKCLPDPYTYQKGLKLLKGREDWELESAKIRFNTGKMICQDQLENKHKATPVNGRCLAPSRIMSRMLRGKPAKPQWKLETSIGLILTLPKLHLATFGNLILMIWWIKMSYVFLAFIPEARPSLHGSTTQEHQHPKGITKSGKWHSR